MLPYDWNGALLHSFSQVLSGDYLALTPSGTSAITQLPGANTLMRYEVISLRRGTSVALAFRGLALPRFSVPRRAFVTVAALPSIGTLSLRITVAIAGCGGAPLDYTDYCSTTIPHLRLITDLLLGAYNSASRYLQPPSPLKRGPLLATCQSL